jgi:glycosyltransferase involved in cell wall biosynthesis
MQTVAVIPAYNEASTVGTVIRETDPYVDEVAVVDDGSTDDTLAVARAAGATVIKHAVNRGVGGAVRTGYRYAIRNDYELVIQIDADGQHDPSNLPALLDKAEENDMVIGSRYLNESFKDYSLVRRVGIRTFTALVNHLGGIEISDVTSGYRIYRVEMLANILHTADAHWAVEQTLSAAKSDYRISEVSVEIPVRETGESQFSIGTFLLYPARMTDTVFRILLYR